jgi:hypothetical protein
MFKTPIKIGSKPLIIPKTKSLQNKALKVDNTKRIKGELNNIDAVDIVTNIGVVRKKNSIQNTKAETVQLNAIEYT